MCVCVCVCCTCFVPVYRSYTYLPTPLLGQDMTQGQFLSGV